MTNSATTWCTRVAVALLVLFGLLYSTASQSRPLPAAFQCTSAPLFTAGQAPSSGWREASSGAIQLQAEHQACWIRLVTLPEAGEYLTVKNGWADVILYDARGQVLAHGNRNGTRVNAVVSANHVMFPTDGNLTAPLYLRVGTRMENIRNTGHRHRRRASGQRRARRRPPPDQHQPGRRGIGAGCRPLLGRIQRGAA